MRYIPTCIRRIMTESEKQRLIKDFVRGADRLRVLHRMLGVEQSLLCPEEVLRKSMARYRKHFAQLGVSEEEIDHAITLYIERYQKA